MATPSQMRLTAGLWVAAYLNRLRLANLPAYVMARGDATAGAVLVKVATLDGQAVIHERRFDLDRDARIWQVMAQGAEPDMDALLTRARGRDPDLWIIEIEDRAGRSLLEEGGLSD